MASAIPQLIIAFECKLGGLNASVEGLYSSRELVIAYFSAFSRKSVCRSIQIFGEENTRCCHGKRREFNEVMVKVAIVNTCAIENMCFGESQI